MVTRPMPTKSFKWTTALLFAVIAWPASALVINNPDWPELTPAQTTTTVGASYTDSSGATINQGDLPNGRTTEFPPIDRNEAGGSDKPADALASSTLTYAGLQVGQGIDLSTFVTDPNVGIDNLFKKCCGLILQNPTVLDVANFANADVQAASNPNAQLFPSGNFATAHVQTTFDFEISGHVLDPEIIPIEVDGLYETCATSSDPNFDMPDPFVSFDISQSDGTSLFSVGTSGTPRSGNCPPISFNRTLHLTTGEEYVVSMEAFAAANGFNGVLSETAQAVMDPTITFTADFPNSDQFLIAYSSNLIEALPTPPLAGPGPPPSSGVPEPATLALLGVGIAGLAASRRRKVQ